MTDIPPLAQTTFPKPTGGDEIIAAVIDAARSLFAEADPSTVTLRQIAERASVNYGLIHRHLGTKRDVVAAVVRRHSANFVPSTEARTDASALITEMASHYLREPAVARSLAWAALNGAEPAMLVEGLPDVRELVDRLEHGASDPMAARRFFAFAAAAVLGVSVFGDVGLAAAQVEPSAEHHASLEAMTIELLAGLVQSLIGGQD